MASEAAPLAAVPAPALKQQDASLAGRIDGGGVERAARLVVALDASAAATILQALPVTHVQQVTAALSTLDAPEHAELQEAVQSFLEELELGEVGDYRAANEAA
jgi:flagellar motor switch protein FliG